MPRLRRIVIPNYPHHVTQRGNRRQQVFFDDEDYEFYLNALYLNAKHYGVEVVAFCLMPNHVHLLLIPSSRESLISMAGELHHKYSKYLNFKMKWAGRLWQGRFYSVAMDHEHTQQCIPYIEANPIRAGLVKRNEQYKWVSQNVTSSELFENLVDFEFLRKATRTGRPSGSNQFLNIVKQVSGVDLTNVREPGRPKKISQKQN